ncbi:MAG: glycosyltransferase, partial [Rhodopila sp.]
MRIPKILHFCFGFSPTFGHKPWSLIHYVSVASAIEQIRPDHAFMYYEHEPSGPWWDLSCRLFTPVRIDAPREVFGNNVAHPAHRADVVRLRKLLEVGGIYLDADVFVHRSFDPLLDNSAVLGQQGEQGSYGLANAIILSEPGSEFVRRWYESYRTFRSHGRDEYWDEHSVKVPAVLAARHPEMITILPHRAFFWPRWHNDHLKMIFGTPSAPILTDATFATH